jgi:hypothetical protein
MKRTAIAALVVALSACGSDGRPVNIPEVAPGDNEAACQTLCTRDPGDEICTDKHVEFCLAKCRARTNGLAPTCAACIIAAGITINGLMDGNGDSYCTVGGPADMTTCTADCDDAGAVPTPAELSVMCELECAFYMQDTSPLACSDEGADPCRADCAAALAANGRICSQCLLDQTLPTRFCFNDDCDCEPVFDDDTTFGCMELCDAM